MCLIIISIHYSIDLKAVYLVEELVVQFMTVIKNVFVCGVQTRFHAVLHHHTGSWWTLELLYLHKDKYTRLIKIFAFRVRCS